MSVVNVKRQGEGRSARDGAGGPATTEVYNVLLDAEHAYGHVEAKNAPGVPPAWSGHPNLYGMFAVSRDCRPMGGGLYEVTITYGTQEQVETEQALEDPTAQAFHIQKSWQSSNVQIDTEINGEPIVNSAGESFDPPLSDEVLDEVFTLTGFNDDVKEIRERLDDSNDSVNDDPIYGREAGTGLMRTAYQRMTLGERRYLAVTITLVFREPPEGVSADHAWDRRVLDQGYRIVDGTDDNGLPKYMPIRGSDGQPLSQATMLDGSGGKLPAGAPAVWLYFRRKKRRRWAELNLPPED